jgi:hypothetical protein
MKKQLKFLSVQIFQKYECCLGFEVFTAVVMKSTILWDIKPCSLLKVNRRFGGTYRLLLHGRRISKAGNQRESRSQASLAWLIFRSWRWKRYFPPKRRSTFNWLHAVISQNIVLFTNVIYLWKLNWLFVSFYVMYFYTQTCSLLYKQWNWKSMIC